MPNPATKAIGRATSKAGKAASKTRPTSLHVRKNDTVQVISGKDRGLTGKVIQTLPKHSRVLVEGANRIKKHTRVTTNQRGAQSGGIITQEAPIHISNVQVICPSCHKRSRLGHRRDAEGRSVRTCRRCGSDV